MAQETRSRWREACDAHRGSRRRFLGHSALLGAAVALGGPKAAGAVGQSQLHRLTAANQAAGGVLNIRYTNFPIVDPQVVTNGMWFCAAALLEGLVVADEAGTAAIPATAETWEVSADSTTYTFTIREGAAWSNGDPVTAQDFAWTYQRLLNPESAQAGVTLGANSYQPTLGIVGAEEYRAGALTDWNQVGIKALDDRQLEITLNTPNIDFLMLMTHPSMVAMHQATVEQLPQDWQTPENWVGNGPFAPTEWVVNSSMTLAPNEQYWDRGNVLLSQVSIALIEPGAGTEGAGAAAYESDEADIVGLDAASIVQFQADPELSAELQTVEGDSVTYLAVLRSKNPLMEDVRIRQALALGIDRETIAKANPATTPGPSLIPMSLPEWDDTATVPFDLEQAKALLAEAGYPDGEGMPEIKILAGLSNPVMEALADTWQENLGIEVGLDIVEVGVYVERRWAVQEDDYVGFYYGSFGSPPLWTAWAANLWGPQFTLEFSLPAEVWAEYQQIVNDENLAPADKTARLEEIRQASGSEKAQEYAQTIQQARTEPDPEAALALYKQGAQLRQETFLFTPVVYNVSYYAVKPYVQGLHLLPGGFEYYLKGISVEK